MLQEVASVIRTLVALFPCVQYGPDHYKELEKDKMLVLQMNRENYSAHMTFTQGAKNDLTWWIDNIHNARMSVAKGPSTHTLTTDSSGMGWGISDSIIKDSGERGGG